ncbi:MAG: MarR family transcriptional regulator [Nocardioides sp.]
MVRSRRHAAADAWGSLLRAHARLLPVMDAGVRRTGISLAYYDVLLELGSEPDGRLRMSDLGERVVLSRTRVSRLVDEMVRAGLVAREANADDRRSAYAVITEAGRDSFRSAAPRYLDLIEERAADGLTSDELETLARLLDRLGTGPGPEGD